MVSHQSSAVDLNALKARQQKSWSTGDYSVIGTTLIVISEELCEAVDLHAGQSVLDVATGSGNTAIAAARRYGKYVPPAPSLKPAALWGTEERLRELFGDGIASLQTTKRNFMFRYCSAAHWMEIFSTYYGPIVTAFKSLDADGQQGLARDLSGLLERYNLARDGTLVVPGEYLEVVASKR